MNEPDVPPPPDMIPADDLIGAWRRLSIAWPDGRHDDQTFVLWLQAGTAFADIRIGADGAAEGFAGTISLDGDVCTWHREIDLNPTGSADVGQLVWTGPDRMLERGSLSPYVEDWQRAPDRAPTLVLRADDGILVRVGQDLLAATPAQVDHWTLGDPVIRRSTDPRRVGRALGYRRTDHGLVDADGRLWRCVEGNLADAPL
ncbi:hypothetical protein [Oryzibacter oryziterrae]|uniref:hypothetical protein n=1 Tax=Oryzibacter oryziterrae TaxID=2766474 RepID=UPI001F2962C6|nr:hypothetical protein [Oryzibacter oryziterrae]